MENNEILDQGMHSVNVATAGLTSEDKGYLESASKWAKFMAIMGYIATGFIVLVGLLMMTMGSLFTGASGMGAFKAIGPILGLVYFLMAAPFFFTSLYLYRFASKTQASLYSSSAEHMTEGFKNLKSYFRMRGILTIMIIALYLVAILFSGVFASMAMKQSLGN